MKTLQIKIEYATYEEYMADTHSKHRELLNEHSIAIKKDKVIVVWKRA